MLVSARITNPLIVHEKGASRLNGTRLGAGRNPFGVATTTKSYSTMSAFALATNANISARSDAGISDGQFSIK